MGWRLANLNDAQVILPTVKAAFIIRNSVLIILASVLCNFGAAVLAFHSVLRSSLNETRIDPLGQPYPYKDRPYREEE